MSINGISGGFGQFYFMSASGLADAGLRMDNVANNVANSNTDEFIPARVNSSAVINGGVTSIIEPDSLPMPPSTGFPSQTDYATEGVNLILARRAFEANVMALKSGIESEKSIIDISG